jgi:hypothetical protein
MRHANIAVSAASLLLTCAGAGRAAEPGTSKCAAAPMHQFDFWIGTWKVTDRGKVAGRNHIEAILGGCALLENWSGAGGGSGKSLNFFDKDDARWHQTWIDASGGALFLAGRFENGAMRMEGERAAAGESPATRHRITWTPLPDGRVRQLWESTPLGKDDWQVQFDGTYVRDAEAPN